MLNVDLNYSGNYENENSDTSKPYYKTTAIKYTLKKR